MKRTARYLLLAAVLLLLCGCQTTPPEADALPEVRPHKLIIDTDTGADDSAAIILAALHSEVDILGVTVVSGNVSLEQAADNGLMSLEIAGRTDVPVYCGSDRSIAGEPFRISSVFGEDGMGDAGLVRPSRAPEAGSAVDFILDTVSAFPNEVELIALGPVTNIAMAIRQDPEIMRQVKRIWVMGTAGFGPGNVTSAAEFNTYMDPEAFRILADSGLPITVIGLDTNAAHTYLTREDQAALLQGCAVEVFLGTAIDRYMEYNRTAMGQDAAPLPDAIAMACLLWETYLLEAVPCHADVITLPGEAYGQVLFTPVGSEESSPLTVVSRTRSDLFQTWFLQTLKNSQPNTGAPSSER